MSSMPKDTCTECRQVKRALEVSTFFGCNKHRICKDCLAKQHGPRNRANCEQCPICDLSRRRLGICVRADLRGATGCVACVLCDAHAPGVIMSCRHAYCTPCSRTLPKSALSRNVDGSMKRACTDCEKKANEKFRDETRRAMEHAESCAMLERDAREHREIMEDIALVKEFQSKPRKRQAPKAPEPKPVTIPKGPDFAAPASSFKPAAATQVSAKARGQTSAGAASSTLTRKVSFNPMVQHRTITPLSREKRHSLPPSGVVAGSGTPMLASSTPSWLHSDSEPKTPVKKLRTSSRNWGVNSP